jgi:hypothetical protein
MQHARKQAFKKAIAWMRAVGGMQLQPVGAHLSAFSVFAEFVQLR